MKALSLPRLELCGAVLLTKLMNRVLASLKLEIAQKVYWTDSKIVLAWINSFSRKWHLFVANRVSEIHNDSTPSEWNHVGTKDNPADLVSRGTTPEQLVNSNIWWNGPQWLKQETDEWPGEGVELLTNVPEERKQTVTTVVTNCDTVIEYKRFSSLYKLLRVAAYMLRTYNMLRIISNNRSNKENRRMSAISAEEIKIAKVKVIMLVQSESFSDEIKILKSSKRVQRSSRLIALLPFLDNGILRGGGRLKHAVLPEEVKHPTILPSHHYFTRLVIIHYHEKLLHAGVQTTLSNIREEFWPIFARSRVKEILHKCIKCRKANPKASWQLMGQLSMARVSAARPFHNTGVDYCGPFYIRDRIRRNSKKYKAYATFICMSVKAVHVELVEDLSADSFIAAVKRLIARKGKVGNLYSDNGTNFVGAERVLRQVFETKEFKDSVQEFATSEQINWHFIPARSPHFGGL